MKTKGSPSNATGPLLEAAGWSALLDRVIRGLCHDLNSRVSSLMAVTQLVQLGEPVPDAFAEETHKLGQLVQLLQLIPANLDGEPEALLPQDLVADALKMHAKARDKSYARPPRVDVSESTPAVLVGAGRTVRAMALVIDRLAPGWDQLDQPVVVRGDEKVAYVELPSTAPMDPDPWASVLAEVFAKDGGSLTITETGVTLSFPSLAVSRGPR